MLPGSFLHEKEPGQEAAQCHVKSNNNHIRNRYSLFQLYSFSSACCGNQICRPFIVCQSGIIKFTIEFQQSLPPINQITIRLINLLPASQYFLYYTSLHPLHVSGNSMYIPCMLLSKQTHSTHREHSNHSHGNNTPFWLSGVSRSSLVSQQGQ